MEKGLDFWNESLSHFIPYDIDNSTFVKDNEYFLNVIGNVAGMRLLDIGCGNGETSMHYAKNGALVTAIDFSSTAIENTKKNAEYHGVAIEAFVLDAMDINQLKHKFDIVVGKFILHHIEPFDEFVECLHSVIDTNGRGIFYENNARNKILMFFRNSLVGRFGVPKYGDNVEHPFEYREMKMVQNKFRILKLDYPQFRFFSLLAPYIFKDNPTSDRITRAMDRFVYTKLPFFNRYSYIQILEMLK